MRRAMVQGILVLIVPLAIMGCGSPSTGDTPESSSSAGPSTAITLPDGWTMTDALSAEEVGAVTGKTMEVFPEASSAAQDGRPAGSYTASGVDGSKIYFGVDVAGGEAGYESMLSFAQSGSAQDVAGIGNKAAMVSFSDGRTGILVLNGDAVIRIDWDPKVYTGDATDLGTRLANALLSGMYE